MTLEQKTYLSDYAWIFKTVWTQTWFFLNYSLPGRRIVRGKEWIIIILRWKENPVESVYRMIF